jgi:hypothetical protein
VFKRTAITLVCGSLLAACGSSSDSPSNTQAQVTGKSYSQALAFSRCMREHGVSNFPDPKSSGGGVQLTLGAGSGVKPGSPAFQSAQSACRHLLPGGGPTSGPPSPQARAQMLQISECMRAHGISGFPDPTTKPPTPGTGGVGLVMGHDGVFLAIPESVDPQSPAFQQAAAACHFGPRGGRTSKGP